MLAKTNKNTSEWLNPSAHLEMISRARYMMILLAYYRKLSQYFGFIDSLQNDCLPVIHQEYRVEEVENSYGVDLSEIIRNTPLREYGPIEILDYLKRQFLRGKKGSLESEGHFSRPSEQRTLTHLYLSSV